MIHKAHNPLAQCQLKFDSDESTGEFEGYASVFGEADSDNDTIYPGAFKKTLKSGHVVKMFINHDQRAIPVGDWIEMSEDKVGLRVVGKIDVNHTEGPSLYSALKRGAMDALSIGFTMKEDDWSPKDGFEDDPWSTMWGNREIKSLSLRETSVVSFPANDGARISDVKSCMKDFNSQKDFENFLREAANLSKNEASVFVSLLLKTCRGDPAAVEAKIAESVAQVRGSFETIRNLLK